MCLVQLSAQKISIRHKGIQGTTERRKGGGPISSNLFGGSTIDAIRRRQRSSTEEFKEKAHPVLKKEGVGENKRKNDMQPSRSSPEGRSGCRGSVGGTSKSISSIKERKTVRGPREEEGRGETAPQKGEPSCYVPRSDRYKRVG